MGQINTQHVFLGDGENGAAIGSLVSLRDFPPSPFKPQALTSGLLEEDFNLLKLADAFQRWPQANPFRLNPHFPA